MNEEVFTTIRKTTVHRHQQAKEWQLSSQSINPQVQLCVIMRQARWGSGIIFRAKGRCRFFLNSKERSQRNKNFLSSIF